MIYGDCNTSAMKVITDMVYTVAILWQTRKIRVSENPRSNTRRAEVGTAGLVWWDKIEAWCLGWRENEAVVLVAQREEVEAACLGQWEVEAVGVVAQREEAEAACPEWWEVEAVIISAQREEFKVALLG